jgi:hypothetical protein
VSREPVSVRIPWSTAITGARINLEDFEEDPAPEQAAEEAPLVIRAPTPVPAVPVPVTATEDVITASTPETPLSDVDVAIMAIMEEATVPPPKRKADSASDSTSESESDSDSESDGGSSVATEDTQYEHENDRATYDQSDSDSDSFGPRRQRRATSFATAQTRRHCIRRLVPAPVTCASVLPTTAHPHEDLCLFVSGPAQRLPGYLARPAEVPPLTHVQLEDDRIVSSPDTGELC